MSQWKFLDISKFSFDELRDLSTMDNKDRLARLEKLVKPIEKVKPEEGTWVAPMSFFEEFASVILFGLGVPGFALVLPVVAILSLLIWGRWGLTVVVAGLIPLSLLSIPYKREHLTSFPALCLTRYFSFKGSYVEQLDSKKPYILVAPPHGVFPFGNIITILVFPALMGFSFRGLASSAALRLPIFKQLLGAIGVIDASRASAKSALAKGESLGINSGGVAEIFETNSETGDEVIVLKKRVGLVKLAFQNGASIVPCYLFGNTKLLSLWYDKLGFSRFLSRKMGFALILFWGRFFLPIPFRVPIIGALGKPIEVPKKQDPTQEELLAVQKQLLDAMVELFDANKAAYGWENKRLVIQ